MATQSIIIPKQLLRDVTNEGTNEGQTDNVFRCDEEPHILGPNLGFGFNPLMLGLDSSDPVGAVYQIVRKLGRGAHSSVWLAKDVSHEKKITKGFIAIKVLTVNMTAGIINEQYWEPVSMKKVNDANPKHPGYQHCLPLLHCFVSKSYHGPHLSLVTQALGSDLMSLQRRQPSGVFSVRQTKRIVKQVLLALDYLHRDCGFVHTDVKPQNILVSIQASDEAIARYLKDNFSATYDPRIRPDISPDPIITVKSQLLPDFGLKSSLDNLVVKLADYGESFPLDKIVQGEICQPVLLRAPEIILGHPWSTPIDIWSVGCLIFEYLTGAIFFQLHEAPPITATDSHLQCMVEVLGGFPPSFLASCNRRDGYFDERGELLRMKGLLPRSLEACIADYELVGLDDVAPAAAFIRKCLTIDPSARPSALELLEDDWLCDV